MGVQRGQVVLVDTHAILEAHRTRTWDHLTGYFAFETVSECVAECETGNQRRDVPIPVDTAALRQRVAVHSLPDVDLLESRLRLGARPSLDAGEERLIAHALTREDVWLICSPDGGAVRACYDLDLLDRVIALEDLTNAAGIRAPLRYNFTRDWLSNFRTKLLLDM